MAGKKKGNRGSTLKRSNNLITTKAGFQITEDEYREMRNLVKRVNRKRDKMIKDIADKPLFYGLRKLDEDRNQLRLMGEEDEITIRKRSSSMQQFKTKKEFDFFVRNLRKADSTDYVDYRVKLYKRNYMTALKNRYPDHPDLVNGILMKVRTMKPEKFAEFLTEDRLAQIKIHYSTDNRIQTLVSLREKLGLFIPQKYQDIEDFDMNTYF